MGERSGEWRRERGLSGGVLVIVFLVWVGVCAVFFSLGFLVGYNEKFLRAAPVTEHVTSPSTIPPTVNSPLQAHEAQAKGPARSSSSGRESSEVLPPDSFEPLVESKPSSRIARTLSPVHPSRGSARRSGRAVESARAGSAGAASGEVDMGYTVQVAASRAKMDAEALVKILKTRGYPVFLMAPDGAKSGDKLFRVQVGPFTSLADAQKVREKLGQEGFRPFVRW